MSAPRITERALNGAEVRPNGHLVAGNARRFLVGLDNAAVVPLAHLIERQADERPDGQYRENLLA